MDAIIRHILKPPHDEPRTLIAMKLKGINEIENTREHIDIIMLLTPNS
jgi:hypothetical protein